MGVKEVVFKQLDAVASLAPSWPNTSTLDVDKIAAFSPSVRRDVGGHALFSPANVMKLLEVVRGKETAKGCAGHRDGCGQEDQEDRRGLGRAMASSATA